MRFYRVSYCDNSAGDGFTRLYFTSLREATHAKHEINRNYREDVQKWEAADRAGVNYYDMPVTPGEDPRPGIDVLDFCGTTKQMILQALRAATF